MDHGDQVKQDPRRALPAVDRLVSTLRSRESALPVWALRAGARRALEAARRSVASGAGKIPSSQELVADALEAARGLCEPRPRRVVNATGVVLHTNLGRAVLSSGAAEAAAEAASAYADLELDLSSGRRGNRTAGVAEKLTLLSGAEAALAVNNNAAAVLLACNSLAQGREVVVSRGELVEIGGSFRVPEILARAGVRLVEVGTTNRTHAEDYRRALGPDTGLLLKVHRSNFEQRGFVTEVAIDTLAALGQEAGIPVVEDLGSATLVDLRAQGFPEESWAPGRLARGADLVCFSGDKLLGGPQAGILLGARRWIEALRTNPLARALRLDKLSLAALDWTLGVLLAGRAEEEIPVLRQLLEPVASVEQRARALAERIGKWVPRGTGVTVQPHRAPVGGGSLPGFALDSWAVALGPLENAGKLARSLRHASLPVLTRVQDDHVLFDTRTLLPGDLEAIELAIRVVVEARETETT